MNETARYDRDVVMTGLRRFLGDRLTEARPAREHHSRDESWHTAALPDAVCFPESVGDVVRILEVCNAHRVPVVPFGTGTGLEGGAIATRGGVTLDLSRLNAILRVSPEDLDCTVQAGVTRKQLNEHLRDSGLFFPIDPGADASLGGMAATRASGTNAVRYGTMRENVLSITAVLADGSVVSTGRRARKSAAGYDLTRLLVGSEGTLGVIVELTLRLHGRPAAVSAARVCFPDVDAAVDTAIATIQHGVPVARIELIDAAQMAAINHYSNTSYPEKVTLFLEFHGSAPAVREQAETVSTIATDCGGSRFEWSAVEEERRTMWRARHSAAYAAMAARPRTRAWATDVCVPISRLADCIRETREDVARHWQPPSFLLGHVGDGNFHYVFLVDPDSPEECRAVSGLSERMVRRAVDMGGTCTGEHGVGLGKRAYLTLELGEPATALMRALKTAVDPNGILNPGKLLPERLPT